MATTTNRSVTGGLLPITPKSASYQVQGVLGKREWVGKGEERGMFGTGRGMGDKREQSTFWPG